MGEEQVGENGIHDVSMKENGAVNGGSSTPNVPADVRGQESERSDSGVAKGGQGLGDSFFFFFLETEKVVCGRELWLCGRMSRRSWDERRQVTTTMIMANRGARGILGDY